MSEEKVNYKARRQALANALPADALAIIPAAREKLRNGDAHYRFRQSSDFFYLTGFDEPDAVLCLTAGRNSESILFLRPNNAAEECWTGPRLGLDEAPSVLAVDKTYAIDSLKTYLPELLLGKKSVYYPMGQDMGYEAILREAWRHAKKQARRMQHAPEVFADITPCLGELRLFKDEFEISCLKDVAKLSVLAHEQVMKRAKAAQYEYELEAEFLYALGKQGCRNVAYDSIFAGGARACTLHYTANNQPLAPHELLLVDAGGELFHYAADITRTYPVSGRFTPCQRDLYELVLAAQTAGIKAVLPGKPFDGIQKAILDVLEPGLTELGILKDGMDIKSFYMHLSGHWLGLDVHDVGAYQKDGASRVLEPNMVLTVEPGIYIAKDCEMVDECWRGIGIRIEDDILVTEKGSENLTGSLAVKPEELEAMVGG